MMNRSTYLLCMLVTTAVFFGLTTSVLAGPSATPTPPTPTPATPTPTATPPPDSCLANNPAVETVVTTAKGQKPSVNADITHAITGHIVGGAASYSASAHRIKVCAGTAVTAIVTDSSGGTLSNVGTEGLFCNLSLCTGVIETKQQYKSTSTGSSDKDTIVLLPQ